MDIDAFIRDGYTVVRGAFSPATAAACRDSIWVALAEHGVARTDRTTWTRPVVRINCPDTEPFVAAGASPLLTAAYDELIGVGRWGARRGVGGVIPVRFPAGEDEFPGEVGYHIEGNWWGGDDHWTNVRSRGRGLLALFLFSDVGPDDAPTRLIVGSHRYAAAVLAEAGEAGMPGGAVPQKLQPSVFCRRAAEAIGTAGDVYLCHPFIVHTATWPHTGVTPRLMAQPGIHVTDGFAVDGTDPAPVAQAIVAGLTAAAVRTADTTA